MTFVSKATKATKSVLENIDYSTDPPLEGVERIGDTDFYGTPNEPVEPWDCDRWPSSPLCGQNPFSDKGLDLEVEVSHNNCATCITITPVLAFYKLPPLTYCYVRPECQQTPIPSNQPSCLDSENIFEYSDSIQNDMLNGISPDKNNFPPMCDSGPDLPTGNGEYTLIEIYTDGQHINCGMNTCVTSPRVLSLWYSVTAKNDFRFDRFDNYDPSYSFSDGGTDPVTRLSTKRVGYYKYNKTKIFKNSQGIEILIPQNTVFFNAHISRFSDGTLSEKTRAAAWTTTKIFVNKIDVTPSPPVPVPPPPPPIIPSPNPPEDMDCCPDLKKLLRVVVKNQRQKDIDLEDIRRAVGANLFPIEMLPSVDGFGNISPVRINSIPELVDWTTTKMVELENKIARATGANIMPVAVPTNYELGAGKVLVSNLPDLIKWVSSKMADLENQILDILGRQYPMHVVDPLAGQQIMVSDLTELILFNYTGLRKVKEMVEAIQEPVGVGIFPVKVPTSILYDRGDEQTEIKSLPEFVAWFVKQFDALIGQFPAELIIEDIDPLTEGNQEKALKFPNLAELLIEMMGINITNKINTETTLTAVLNILVEALSIKQTVIADFYQNQATQDYLGAKIKQKTVKVPMTATPGETALHKFLRPTEFDVKVNEHDDEKNLQDVLGALLDFRAKWMAQNFRRVAPNGTEKGQILGLLKTAASLLSDKPEPDKDGNIPKTDFDKFLEDAETGFTTAPGISEPDKPFGRPYDQRARIRQIGENTSDTNPPED